MTKTAKSRVPYLRSLSVWALYNPAYRGTVRRFFRTKRHAMKASKKGEMPVQLRGTLVVPPIDRKGTTP